MAGNRGKQKNDKRTKLLGFGETDLAPFDSSWLRYIIAPQGLGRGLLWQVAEHPLGELPLLGKRGCIVCKAAFRWSLQGLRMSAMLQVVY